LVGIGVGDAVGAGVGALVGTGVGIGVGAGHELQRTGHIELTASPTTGAVHIVAEGGHLSLSS
jgi:hypothetical protein